MPMRREQVAAALRYLQDKADLRGRFERATSLDPQEQDLADIAVETGASLIIPGVGPALAARDFERARRADDEAGMAMAAAGAIPGGKLAKLLKGFDPTRLELDVYHGTPHRFPATEANPLGEFDASKIGTGEGAQAFGHGIYLAEKPTVAQDYQFMLSKIDPNTTTYQGKPVEKWYEMAQAEQDRAHRLRDQKAIDRANAKLAFWENVMTRRHPEDAKRVANDPDDGWPTLANYANSLDMSKFGGIGEAGSLYKADLPDEMIDRMLDWDKPLSEQPKSVRQFFEPLVAPIRKAEAQGSGPEWGDFAAPRDYDPPGSELMQLLGRLDQMSAASVLSGGTGGAASSAKLQTAGIPGIKYFDAGSRGQGGTGTRNFVVFPGEEKKVRILERDGKKVAEMLQRTAPASAEVEIDLYPLRGDANTLYLSKIAVPEGQRGQGLGTKAMQDVIARADAEGKRVVLSPSTEYGATSVGRLKDFYKRFGFVENKGRNKNYAVSQTMYRDPKKPK